MRHDGEGLPTLVGLYLGKVTKTVMLVFSVLLLMMVGVVFVYSPALIMETIWGDKMMWIVVIFIYYVIATLLPIDKVIGKIYPLFAFCLLVMALGLLIGLFVKWPTLPELWNIGDMSAFNNAQTVDGKDILGVSSYLGKNPLFPCLFITIACGAISGFHATQSPLMARCLKSERLARPVFYGAMITEGIVALIWATVSSYFFYYGGWREVVSPEMVNAFLAQVSDADGKTLIQYFSAPTVVEQVCRGWMGVVGGILAILGVVAAPITSGDTAFRSARLIVAEWIHLDQRSIPKRLYICVPMFAVAILLLFWQIENPDGFNVIWQYFGWSNQTLSVFTLWTLTVYLVRQKKPYIITLIPALFMTTVCSMFLLISPQALGMSEENLYWGCPLVICVALAWFYIWFKNDKKSTTI